MNPQRSCSTCVAASPNGQQLFCRMNPPVGQVLPMPQQHPITGQVSMSLQTMAAFPPVQPDQWCVQWAPGQTIQLAS